MDVLVLVVVPTIVLEVGGGNQIRIVEWDVRK